MKPRAYENCVSGQAWVLSGRIRVDLEGRFVLLPVHEEAVKDLPVSFWRDQFNLRIGIKFPAA